MKSVKMVKLEISNMQYYTKQFWFVKNTGGFVKKISTNCRKGDLTKEENGKWMTKNRWQELLKYNIIYYTQ